MPAILLESHPFLFAKSFEILTFKQVKVIMHISKMHMKCKGQGKRGVRKEERTRGNRRYTIYQNWITATTKYTI